MGAESVARQFGPGWSAANDRPTAITTFRHVSGLWFEISTLACDGYDPFYGLVAEVLRAEIKKGTTGRVVLVHDRDKSEISVRAAPREVDS